jgi:iron complex outermembrane receptor protein
VNNRFRLTKLAAATAALSLAEISGHANAAEPESRIVLEEIVVTAQKREENLGDVPLSVNVIDNQRIETGNINKIADITEFVPNLAMTETGVSTQLYVRGIG